MHLFAFKELLVGFLVSNKLLIEDNSELNDFELVLI